MIPHRVAWSIALMIVATVLCGFNIAGEPQDGTSGISTVRNGPCTRLIVEVIPGHDQQFRTGDVIQDAGMQTDDRLHLKYTPRSGQSYVVPVQRGGTQINITTSLHWPQYRWFEELSATGLRLVMLVTGLMLLWRGRDRASFYLGAFFVGLAPTWVTAHYDLPVALAVAANVIAGLGQWLAFAGLFFFARDLGRDTKPHAITLWAARAFPVALAVAVAALAMMAFADVTTGCRSDLLNRIESFAGAIVILTPLIMLTDTYFKSSGAARLKLRWIFLSSAIGLAGPAINAIAQATNHPAPIYGGLGLGFIAMPLGFAYVTLRHRIIDVSFVINRALVYTLLMSIIVGAFALLENTLEHYAFGERVTVAFQIGATVIIALSFDWLQKRIDKLVDSTFFRRKHEAQEAFNRLAHEAAFMESGEVLLDRLVHDVQRRLGAGTAVYERSVDGYSAVRRVGADSLPEHVDVDDRAFVGLRAGATSVNLTDTPSVLCADGVALPLAVGGVLQGALVVCGRSNDEAYDPDEISTLRHLAHAVATALDAIRARRKAELLEKIADGTIAPENARTTAAELLRRP